jgi:hypothetical protein
MDNDLQQKKKTPTLSKEFDRFDELRVYKAGVRSGLSGPWPQAAIVYDRALRALRERFGCSDKEITMGPIETDTGECKSVFDFQFDAQDHARFDLKLTEALDKFTISDPDSKRLLAGGIPVTEYDALASKLTDCFKRRWQGDAGAPKALPAGNGGVGPNLAPAHS